MHNAQRSVQERPLHLATGHGYSEAIIFLPISPRTEHIYRYSTEQNYNYRDDRNQSPTFFSGSLKITRPHNPIRFQLIFILLPTTFDLLSVTPSPTPIPTAHPYSDCPVRSAHIFVVF